METTPMQPELRPFIVYDEVPPGCATFFVSDDRTAPLLRPGDVVIFDRQDHEPADGELFVIQHDRGDREISQVVCRSGRYGIGADGKHLWSEAWWTAAFSRPRSFQEGLHWGRSGRVIPMGDGPYAGEDGAAYLREKLQGRIIGILSPNASPCATMRSLG